MDLEPLDQTTGFAGLERFVQARQVVDVEVVHHQDDGRRTSVRLVGETAQEVRHVDGRTSLGHLDDASPSQRLYGSEDIGRPASLVFIIDPGRCAGARGDGLAGVIEQLLAGLVEADLRPVGS